MSNFYLRHKHLFEEANEIPYTYQAERLYQLLPKLKYDQKLPRDIFREKEQDDYPSKNIFAQNARTLLGSNFDSPQLHPQQDRQERYSNPVQRESHAYKKDSSLQKDPFKRDVQPPQRDSQPFHQNNYPLPRESHQNKNDHLPSYDPFKRGFQQGSPSKVDQRSAGLSKPKYDESNHTKRRYAQNQPSPSPFAVGEVNTDPSDYRKGYMPMQRGRVPTDFSPTKDIPAAGRAVVNRVASAFEGNSSFLEHPTSVQEPVRSRWRKEPSPGRQQYEGNDSYINPQLAPQQQERHQRISSYLDENNKILPPQRQIPESTVNKGYEPLERPRREQNRSESPKYYTMGTRGSPKKITQAINESIKQNIFPNHAYIQVKKRVLNVRGDLSRLDEAPFPKDKTVLTATLQNRSEQLGSIGTKKTIQEALEYRILMTVPGDRKERLKKLLQSEGSIPQGI